MQLTLLDCAVRYHPDKNIDDPSTEIDEQKEANNMFIRITKAHDTLTDEAAAENYRKYGNPDGSQGIKCALLACARSILDVAFCMLLLYVVVGRYGIGLPAFMFEQTKAVLVVYLLGRSSHTPLSVPYCTVAALSVVTLAHYRLDSTHTAPRPP